MTVDSHALLLILAVLAVGVLHTIVPDHWLPIALLARQHGWTNVRTARAAALAGLGHTVSTLVIAVIFWAAGAVLATRFGNVLSVISGIALVLFGAWIALSSWREQRHEHHDHGHSHFGHSHVHRHADGVDHRHWHEHHDHDWHAVDGNLALVPDHEHVHKTSSRTALLLILGSSPMVEGIPAFFAASHYGVWLLASMALVFALATMVTYVVLCVASARGMQRLDFGQFERYGEALSGSFIALVGLVFLIWPVG